MNSKLTIKLLGILFITVGSLQLIVRLPTLWDSSALLLRPGAFPAAQEFLSFSAASLFFLTILPLATLTAGIGLIRIRRWGWLMAMLASSATFIVNSIGLVIFALAVHKSQNQPPPPTPEGTHFGFISMWPTYIYAVISAMLIVLLTRSSIRSAFGADCGNHKLST